MDFEEGEVDDLSDSELERSPAVTTEGPNGKDVGHIDPTHSQPHSRHKRERTQRPKSRHSKGAHLTRTNGHVDPPCFSQSDAAIHPKRHKRRASLKEYLSDGDDVDSSAMDGGKKSRPHGLDSKHKKRRRVERVSRPIVQTQCRYFMEGRCAKGDACPFAHDFQPPKKQELCKFYAVGVCSKGPTCLFLHGEFPCKFFHLSGKCNHGGSCKFSHAPLTADSKLLLDRIAGVKELPPSSHSRCSDACRPTRGSLHSGFTERCDVDYRFGHRPPHYSDPDPNYEPQSPPHMTHGPNFHPAPPGNPHEPRDLLGPRPPFTFLPGNRMETPRFGLENRFRIPMGNAYIGPNYGPPFPSPGISDGPFPPLGPRKFPPEHSLPTRFPPHMVPRDGSGQTDFPRFRSRGPLPLCPPFNPSLYPTSEAIVSSELDKMAALLASNKTPETLEATASPPSDPRIQSPISAHKLESNAFDHGELKSPTLPSDFQAPDISSPGSQLKKPPPNFTSPEPNVMPPQPTLPTSPNAVHWRLIQLDMNVKIPYPLMQLPIEDLPHRYEDPRLRGQLATLRSQPKPTVPKDDNFGCEIDSPKIEDAILDSSQLEEDVAKPVAATSRRPVKLQLNEMASTFANIHSTMAVSTPTRAGDRSYLDDPRFRRRRIVATAPASEVPQKDATKVTD